MSPNYPNPAGETRTCPQCLGEFTAETGSRQKYCSPTCKREAGKSAEPEMAAHTCPVCEGEFLADPRVRQVYCSRQCRNEQERRRERARDEERARRLGEPVPGAARRPSVAHQQPPGKPADPMSPTATRECPHCGQPITIVALLTTPEAARPHITQPGAEVVALRRA